MGTVCKHCVLDNSSCIIDFDPQGICNYCNAYFDRQKNGPSLDNKKFILKDMVADIKKQGKSEKFDCLIGLSGGIDSSYLAYFAVRTLGLRPLAVHFDNGWNTELAVDNVNRIIDGLHLELLTYVIDWEEFKDDISTQYRVPTREISWTELSAPVTYPCLVSAVSVETSIVCLFVYPQPVGESISPYRR